MKWLKILLLLSTLSLVSCLEAEIHSPNDMVNDMCSAGVYGQTLIRCVNGNGVLSSQLSNNVEKNSRALFVFIEPGDYSSNLAMQDEALRAVSNGIETRFRPILRQIMINLVVGHQKMLMDQVGKKYDVIYYARTNERWSSRGFVDAIENVTRNHSTVDMLLAVHGGQSSLSLNSDLQTRVTTVDLNSLHSRLSVEARNRVRAIFLTACYSGRARDTVSTSVAEELVSIFPKAMTYGSQGVNFGPVHRDLMAFEYYYRGWGFTSAVWLGNQVLTKNIKDGQPRTKLSMPVFSVKGRARYMGFTKSRREIIKIPALNVNSYTTSLAYAYIYKRVSNEVNIQSLNTDTGPDQKALVYKLGAR